MPATDLKDHYFPLSGNGESKHAVRGDAVASTRFEVLSSAAPIFKWLPSYNWQANIAADALGATTLAFVLLAQSLAHADLCKVEMISGPYGCILPPLLYSLFGTCIHSSIGTGGLVSLITGEQLSKLGGTLHDRTRAGAIFTLLVGVIITLMGLFRLAFLLRFVSRPALSGFITASGLLIMVSQIKSMLGLPKTDAGGIFHIIHTAPWELNDLSPIAALLSVISLAFLMNAKHIGKYHWCLQRLATMKELLLLVVASVVCHAAQTTEQQIMTVGAVPEGLPRLSWPLLSMDDFNLAQELLPGAFLVALVTFISSFAGAKKFGMMAGYQVIAVNELIALGAANIGGAICAAVPTQVGLSRMGIAYSSGVQSQLGANILVAFIIAVAMQFFITYLQYIPRCCLHAVIFAGAAHLLEFDHMCWLWSLRSTRTRQRTYIVDFAVWWVACLTTLYFGALTGVLGAVIVSLLLIIYQVADPPISLLGWVESQNRWMHAKVFPDARPRAGVLAFQLEGPLFYANIERLQEWLAEMEVAANRKGEPLKGIVLSAAAIPFLDTTALYALRQMLVSYSQRNIVFLVANASGQPKKILEHELSDLIPKDCLSKAWDMEKCMEVLAAQEHERCFQQTDPEADAAAGGHGGAKTPRARSHSINRPLQTQADWVSENQQERAPESC